MNLYLRTKNNYQRVFTTMSYYLIALSFAHRINNLYSYHNGTMIKVSNFYKRVLINK